ELAAGDRGALRACPPVDEPRARVDQMLGTGARPDRAGEEDVEPRPGRFCGDRELDLPTAHCPCWAIDAGSRSLRGASRTYSRASTPNVIDMSATLNAGQNGSLMKSVTEPVEMRSIRFPSAPPTSSPVGSHSRRRCGRSAK